jgi:NAD-dependent dihydropyrimidine dehydrogenase PreA subunit
MKIEVDEEKCVGCGTCVHYCPKGGKIWDIKEKAIWCANGTKNMEWCHRCTNCLISCPERAISVNME